MDKSAHPLTRYRDEAGLTLEAFGALIGVNKTTVLRWERNQPPVPVERLAEMERLTGIPRSKIRPDIFVSPQPIEAAE